MDNTQSPWVGIMAGITICFLWFGCSYLKSVYISETIPGWRESRGHRRDYEKTMEVKNRNIKGRGYVDSFKPLWCSSFTSTPQIRDGWSCSFDFRGDTFWTAYYWDCDIVPEK
jgi:hypothetical protein